MRRQGESQTYQNLSTLLAPSHRHSLFSRGLSLSPGQCLVKVSSLLLFFRFRHLYSLALLFGLEFIADDPLALQQSPVSDGPALAQLLQLTGNLASVMLCTLPLGALSHFTGACVLSTTPLLALRSLPVCPVLLICAPPVRTCSPLFLHPAPCPCGCLSTLVTPLVVLP